MSSNGRKAVHRLQQARNAAGVSIRSMTARTGLPASTLKTQEESDDLYLSDFIRWQRALAVPFEELVEPYTGQMADHIRFRASLVRLMKSVKALYQDELSERQQNVVNNVVYQLEQIMPELSDVESWPQFGPRRNGVDTAPVELNAIETSMWCPEINEA